MDDLRQRYEERLLTLRQLSETLCARTTEALGGLAHVDRVGFRVKDVGSFLAKANSGQGNSRYQKPLVEVEDQVAGRVIVFFTSDIIHVRTALLRLYRPIEIAPRRPQRDDEFGYQSEHLILMIPPWAKPRTWQSLEDTPATFEMQLRTLFMHAYAEPQHDIAYKSAHDLTPEVRRELAWIAASAWGADAAFLRIHSALENADSTDAPLDA